MLSGSFVVYFDLLGAFFFVFIKTCMEVSIRVFIDLFEKGLIFCAVVTNNWKVKKNVRSFFFQFLIIYY